MQDHLLLLLIICRHLLGHPKPVPPFRGRAKNGENRSTQIISRKTRKNVSMMWAKIEILTGIIFVHIQ